MTTTASMDSPMSLAAVPSGVSLSVPALDPLLLGTAQAEHGMLTTAQATRAGLSAATLVALVKTGVLRHPGRGLYAAESLVDPAPEGWHRQLCAGAFWVRPTRGEVVTTE